MPADERGAGRSAMQMEVRKLTVGYGAAWVLDQVSLQIGAGEFVGIVGCTGCGKTTLLKAMAGLLEVQDGEILLDGENIFSRRFDRAVLRRKVGMVFQYPEYQLFAQTVEKDVGFGRKNRNASDGRWSRWDFPMKKSKISRRFLYPAEKSAEWRSPVFWRQSRSF